MLLALQCLGGALFVLILYYPGLFSWDSVAQFEEAQSGYYSDGHPPMMALVWGITDLLIPGPFGMLLLNTSMLWLGLFFIAGSLPAGLGKTRFLLPLSGLIPPVLGIAGMIWKDIALGSSFLFAVGLICRAQQLSPASPVKRWGMLAIALVAIFYGSAVRHNALPAVLPLLAFWGFVVAQWARRPLRKLVLGLAAVAGASALAAANQFMTYEVLEAQRNYFYQFILLDDLGHLSVQRDLDLVPPAFRRSGYTRDRLIRADANVMMLDQFIFGQESPYTPTRDQAQLRELRTAWQGAVWRSPIAWLDHRLVRFDSLMGFGRGPCYGTALESAETSGPYGFTGNRLTLLLAPALGWFETNTWLYKGWLWLLIDVGLIGRAIIGNRRGRPSLALPLVLASSSILYLASYLLVTVSCDFRYLWWSVLSTTVACFVVVGSAFTESARRFPWASAKTHARN